MERGANFSRVADDLAARGAIGWPYIFKVGADYAEKAGGLKAGSFLIQPNASMREIVDTVTRSGQSTCGTEVNYRIGVAAADVIVRELDPAANAYVEVVKFDPAAGEAPADYLARAEDPDVRFRVTLAEGVTSWQVVEALKRAEFLAGEPGEDIPAEGYAGPDSYEVERGHERKATSRRDAGAAGGDAGRPVGQARRGAALQDARGGADHGLHRREGNRRSGGAAAGGERVPEPPAGWHEASDRPDGDLRDHQGQGVLGRGLRQSELRGRTPYNTYVIDGLPPTPIANPGRDSIAAALNPEKTEYLFFVADGSGGHVFAETLAEHNDNVAKWRAIEAQQQEQGTSGN